MILWVAAASPVAADEPAWRAPLHGESAIEFATVDDARRLLARPDEYTAQWSRFDLESRLGTQEGATPEALLRHAAGAARPWSDEQRAAIAGELTTLRERLRPLDPRLFPPVVPLILTSGDEEAQAAYCRQGAIILPERLAAWRGERLRKLLAHELFHILSAHDRMRRARLYAIVGFEPCPVIALPEPWHSRRITNPDAPRIDVVATLTIDGRDVLAAPVLLASVERYDVQAGGGFFRYLQFRLLELTRDEGRLAPRLVDGEPRWFDPQTTPAYFERIGRNTKYIIHPEEVLADNFVHLLESAADLPNPEIIDRLRAELSPPARVQ